jgi:predicted cupin superfamily sugar epimerase
MGESAGALIEQLGLAAHPEGGWYRETWRGEPGPDGRAQGTAIIFLLKEGEASHWHTVDAAELWLWQAGDPLELRLAADDAGPVRSVILGSDVAAGQALQGYLAAHAGENVDMPSAVRAAGRAFEYADAMMTQEDL